MSKDAEWAAKQIRSLLLSDHRTISTEEMRLIEGIIDEVIEETWQNAEYSEIFR